MIIRTTFQLRTTRSHFFEKVTSVIVFWRIEERTDSSIATNKSPHAGAVEAGLRRGHFFKMRVFSSLVGAS
jgi:hypothetical protein